jgi:hypothetical protein
MQVLPFETNGKGPSFAPTGSLKGSHNLACVAMLRDPGVPDDRTDNVSETTTAQECVTINEVNNYPCTADAEMEFHSLISDVNIMEGMSEPIPEERPTSSLSKFEHSSIEDASSRDYGSVSSLSPNYGHFSNLSHSPLPLADVQNYMAPQSAPTVDRSDSRSRVRENAQQEDYTLIQDVETTDTDQDWDMTGSNSIAELPIDATSPAGAEPYMQQALAPLPAPTYEVSPTALLLMIESKHILIDLSEGDAVRIEKLAELFECARSYQDAYQLRRLLLLYAPRQTNMKDPASNRTLLNAIMVPPDEARRRLEALRPKMLMMRNGVDLQSRLFDVLGWCVNTLAEDGFWKMLLPVTSDLWLQAPDEAHLRDVESTLLFIYLWSQQPSQSGRHNLISDSVGSRSSCVPAFAHAWGISVAEVLSVIANYIITTLGPHELCEKRTLARRALTAATFGYETVERNKGSQDMLASFRDARVAIHHQSASQSNTEDYAALVRTAIRDIVERSFHLELEIPALRDQRLQNRLSQASMCPSYSPTMLSTPRSSWSGFQSFKLTARRASKIWANTNNSNEDIQSLLSSRRWSQDSPMVSALTLQSTTISTHDVIMEDDDEI